MHVYRENSTLAVGYHVQFHNNRENIFLALSFLLNSNLGSTDPFFNTE